MKDKHNYTKISIPQRCIHITVTTSNHSENCRHYIKTNSPTTTITHTVWSSRRDTNNCTLQSLSHWSLSTPALVIRIQ